MDPDQSDIQYKDPYKELTDDAAISFWLAWPAALVFVVLLFFARYVILIPVAAWRADVQVDDVLRILFAHDVDPLSVLGPSPRIADARPTVTLARRNPPRARRTGDYTYEVCWVDRLSDEQRVLLTTAPFSTPPVHELRQAEEQIERLANWSLKEKVALFNWGRFLVFTRNRSGIELMLDNSHIKVGDTFLGVLPGLYNEPRNVTEADLANAPLIWEQRNRKLGEDLRWYRAKKPRQLSDTLWQSFLHESHDSEVAADAILSEVKAEAFWFALQVLYSDFPNADTDLPQLEELVHVCYPLESDYEKAMEWARGLYDFHAERNRYVSSLWQYEVEFRPLRRATVPKACIALPPRSDFTMWWLLYQHVGLTEKSSSHVRTRWLSCFPKSNWERVSAWGVEIAKERRDAGEALPPPGPNIPLLCAVERVTGTDEYGRRCWAAIPKQRSLTRSVFVAGGAEILYPCESLWILRFADKRLIPGLSPVGLILLAFPLFWYGVRRLFFWGFAEHILLLKGNPHYQAYRERRRGFRIPEMVIRFLLVPILAWQLVRITLPQSIQSLVDDLAVFAGTCTAVFLGGLLTCCVQWIVTLICLWCRYPVQNGWLDEVLGTTLSLGILLYFGSGLTTAAASCLLGLVPEIFARVGEREYLSLRPRGFLKSWQFRWVRTVRPD